MPPQRGKSGAGRPDQADEIGSEAAKKYNGLFSEKDWKCKLCSNINWARRNVCNQCQSPKPGSGTDAQREGHGGGFFDREAEIEYRETRYQDDDEYDDFGRLKKKKRNGSGQEGSAEPVSRPRMAAEADQKVEKQDRDDDDDDDGDGDDGKWDAWADILGDDTKTESVGTKATSVASEEKTYAAKLERDRSPQRDRDYRYRDRRRSRSRSRSRTRSDHGERRGYERRSRSPRYRNGPRGERSYSREEDRGYRRVSRSRSRDRYRRR
ncbi:uncharacterized protein SPPG_00934, partial [Spizellomyces punctatus DAOM BR117]